MKLRYSLLFITIGLLFACKSEEEKALISEEKFVDVLIDIHLADGTLTVMGYKVTTDSIKIEKHYNYIFSKHNISRLKFEKTLQYYSAKPEKLDLIYEKVIEQLTIMQGQLEEKEV